MYHDLTWQLVTDRQRRYRRESGNTLPPQRARDAAWRRRRPLDGAPGVS